MRVLTDLQTHLSCFPHIPLTLDENRIFIKSSADDGFDVEAVRRGDQICVSFGPYLRFSVVEEAVKNLVQLGLSETTRLIESPNGGPAALQVWDGEYWRDFGAEPRLTRLSTRTRQNHYFPMSAGDWDQLDLGS